MFWRQPPPRHLLHLVPLQHQQRPPLNLTLPISFQRRLEAITLVSGRKQDNQQEAGSRTPQAIAGGLAYNNLLMLLLLSPKPDSAEAAGSRGNDQSAQNTTAQNSTTTKEPAFTNTRDEAEWLLIHQADVLAKKVPDLIAIMKLNNGTS